MTNDRLTCRDRDGKARIRNGCTLEECIEKLTRIEERAMGVMIAKPTNQQIKAAENQRKRWEMARKAE